jgi:hypothetical protein
VVSGCAELLRDLKALPDELKSAVRPPRPAAVLGQRVLLDFHKFPTISTLSTLSTIATLSTL